MTKIALDIQSINLTDEQFFNLCRANETWKLEKTAKGELILMSPVGGTSGYREADFIGLLWSWNRQINRGVVFSSSTIFRLPNGGARSPDAAWVELSRWQNLTPEQQDRFPPICPDFAIELRSRTDDLLSIQEKMQEYLDAGLRLGWLVNPQQQQVEIYRQNQAVETVNLPTTLQGEEVLPGFELELPLF
ncbi:MAG: Uma2 family endonuclease [Jaaginema sp. PMC 1079.18]|nr:Uma2 family endonuclease [Jaaginema sp. PMC 1080.18]MEC4849936.1 Uma2 family endonuclease [Jaaginema sp. PMC 1079.18]MEC4865167.1 Uma2 family endonuclease [Jaaginema sp. PMC 1078.18]